MSHLLLVWSNSCFLLSCDITKSFNLRQAFTFKNFLEVALFSWNHRKITLGIMNCYALPWEFRSGCGLGNFWVPDSAAQGWWTELKSSTWWRFWFHQRGDISHLFPFPHYCIHVLTCYPVGLWVPRPLCLQAQLLSHWAGVGHREALEHCSGVGKLSLRHGTAGAGWGGDCKESGGVRLSGSWTSRHLVNWGRAENGVEACRLDQASLGMGRGEEEELQLVLQGRVLSLILVAVEAFYRRLDGHSVD